MPKVISENTSTTSMRGFDRLTQGLHETTQKSFNPSRPSTRRREKYYLNFFTFFCGVSKGLWRPLTHFSPVSHFYTP